MLIVATDFKEQMTLKWSHQQYWFIYPRDIRQKNSIKNQNGWVRIGEESVGVLSQKIITLRLNRTSFWKGKYTK
jgi:hypothetical protein